MSDDTHGRSLEDVSGLAAFERMLDAFGGVIERWPADGRSRAEALLRRTDAVGMSARQALTHAQALDRLLAEPPVLDDGRVEALSARIVAAARSEAVKPNVVPITAGRRRPPLDQAGKVRAGGRWAAAAVLAASLLVGVVIGPGSLGWPALQDAADTIGLGSYVDQLALAPTDDDAATDEDVL